MHTYTQADVHLSSQVTKITRCTDRRQTGWRKLKEAPFGTQITCNCQSEPTHFEVPFTNEKL